MQLQEGSSSQLNSEATNHSLSSTDIESPQFAVNRKNRVKGAVRNTWNRLSDGSNWMAMLKFTVPLAIPLAAFIFSIQQDRIAIDNQRQEAMSAYFDQMTALILQKDEYGEFRDNPAAQLIARAKTLNTLRQLDGERKGQVLKFLYEAKLIGECPADLKIDLNNFQLKPEQCQPSVLNLNQAKLDGTVFEQAGLQGIALTGIDLQGASLANAQLPSIGLAGADMQSVQLDGANLKGAFLRGAKMWRAFLIGTQLTDADLTEANLNTASLIQADLRGAKLRKAILQSADLRQSNLDNADLQGADLRNANLEGASLDGANLQGAIYDDKTKFGGFDREGKGLIRQP